MRPLASLAADLRAGTTTSRALVEECLRRIADADGEGSRVFIRVYADAARAQADRQDAARRSGTPATPLAGIPLSVKDLFDVAGEVTTAGSKVLREQPPARSDAVAVARLRAAGLVIMGRTNMTEFAYSGLGLNPHYGTPANPFDRQHGRIPGGSSSGAAVSVTDGMACAAVGTDTGGSCRIPAAFCGIVGFKPTAHRVPQGGRFRSRPPWTRSGHWRPPRRAARHSMPSWPVKRNGRSGPCLSQDCVSRSRSHTSWTTSIRT